MKRRTFIKMSATTSGALVFGVTGTLTAEEQGLVETDTLRPNFFLSIDKSAQISFYLTKLEMGQGVGTGYKMIIAEELEVRLDKIKLIHANFNPDSEEAYKQINNGVTGGSRSVRLGWNVLRESAAMAKMTLILAASRVWNVSPKHCFAREGFVINKINSERLPYEKLISVAAKSETETETKLKCKSEFSIIGQPLPNRLSNDIVNARVKYGIDRKVSNMVYAAIKRCPVLGGLITDYDDSETLKVPGVIRTVHLDHKKYLALESESSDLLSASVRDGVAVIANNTWAAFEGVKRLDIKYDRVGNKEKDVATLRSRYLKEIDDSGESIFKCGNPKKEFETATKIYSSTYETPYNTHLFLEPLNAIADVKHDSCKIWVGTQAPHLDASTVALVTGIPKEHVEVNVSIAGGSFGRRFDPDVSIEAARLSKELKIPVKVTWSREDEIKLGKQSNFELQQFDIALNRKNEIASFSWKIVASDRWVAWRNPYFLHLDHLAYEKTILPKTLETGAWRAVGTGRTNFGVESFIDELAHYFKKDPIEFRQELLSPVIIVNGINGLSSKHVNWAIFQRQKMLRTLDAVKKLSGWKEKKTIGETFLGVACGSFSHTVSAQVVELSISGQRITIHKVYTVIDCGIVVNPNLAKQQVEGSIIWGLSALFKNSTQFKNSEITQSNFHDADVLRMFEAPSIEIQFVESDEAPKGLGEPSVCSIIPATANALHSATGKRYFSRPITSFHL